MADFYVWVLYFVMIIRLGSQIIKWEYGYGGEEGTWNIK